MSMIDIANLIEDGTRALVEEDTSGMLQSGIGFPTGLSLNHVAAHYTPNANDKIGEHEIFSHGEPSPELSFSLAAG